MKVILSIVAIFVHIAMSQAQANISTSEIKIDSTVINRFNFKEKSKRVEYKNYLSQSLFKLDTVFKSEDSIVVNFLAKNNKVLKTEKNYYYPSTGQKIDSIIEYYNAKGFLEFVEKWDCVLTIFDSPEHGMMELKNLLPRQPNGRQRYEYNESGKEILAIVTLANGTMYRIKSFYDLNGNLINNTKEQISEYQFWE